MTAHLSVYEFESCPFCRRVRAAIDDLGLEVEARNVRHDPEHARDLMAAMGRGTVPVLRIDEAGDTRWLPESADIVDHLYGTYGGGRRPAMWAGRALPRGLAVVAVGIACTALVVPEDMRPVALGLAAALYFGRHHALWFRRLLR